MNNPVIFFLNTHGVTVLLVSVVFYQFAVLRDEEAGLHTIFSAAAALIITLVLKELFEVPRPFIVEAASPGAGLAHFSSFPSTHTALAFSVATTVTLHKRKLGIFVFMLASLIAIGRVLGNVHYPVDIAFGILIGVVSALFFDSIHFKTSKKRV